MKVLTPMMAKISQKMMHTVNTLKILDKVVINYDPILVENEQMLWKLGDDDMIFWLFLTWARRRPGR